MSRLLEILEHKRTEVARLDPAEERAKAADAPPTRDFLAAVKRRAGAAGTVVPVRLIAEIKKASPSRGVLAPGLNVADIARIYVENGAAALSVLTDEKYFLGKLAYLSALRHEHAVAVPLLRKDFMLAPVQLYEARAAGADAILLIVAALEDAALADLHALARDLGLTALVEAHSAEEVERALRIPGLQLLGVNNRNLHTFEVRRQTALELRAQVPAEIAMVSESGIFTAEHVSEVAAAGIDAILVGEALVTAPDIAQKVRELVM
ncbi:MAG TPA: indole-3-glycerol phosphate synthase TrpC [Anaerolineales bacterium]|nr:indole-3-glycerol phosphate synthase TrpC [Anaerolineales bacterium]